MAIFVQKFGGTSVGSVERIRNVARRVAKWKAAGHDLVVVPSAMAGETDRLIALARQIQALPDPRELDVVAATGEQVTIGLLAMALMDLGVKARSYTGWQVKIVSDSAHNKARIVSIDQQRIRADIHAGRVVVVAGFQGVDGHDNLTTLGRGGSDTSAVALAAALKADECHIYTDVDGVYTTDPRLVPEARRLRHVTFEEMIEMAGAGSKVLQSKCRAGTGDDRIAKVSIGGMGMRSHAGIAAQMFRTLAEEGINIQMISTSEIKITVVIEEKYTELAVRVLHKAFELDQE